MVWTPCAFNNLEIPREKAVRVDLIRSLMYAAKFESQRAPRVTIYGEWSRFW